MRWSLYGRKVFVSYELGLKFLSIKLWSERERRFPLIEANCCRVRCWPNFEFQISYLRVSVQGVRYSLLREYRPPPQFHALEVCLHTTRSRFSIMHRIHAIGGTKWCCIMQIYGNRNTEIVPTLHFDERIAK